MTCHVLTLKGERRSGRSVVGMDLADYRSLTGDKVAYIVPDESSKAYVQATGLSVPLFTENQIDKLWGWNPTLAILDAMAGFRDILKLKLMLQARMQSQEFSQIIIIE